MSRFISMTRSPILVLCSVSLGLYACSFQDFEYLKEGDAEAGAAGVAQSASGGAGGSSGGTAGTESTPGGAGGDGSEQGGEAGVSSSGAPNEGGAPAGGSGGAGEGGTPTLDTGGEGGAPTGVSGEGGASGERAVMAGAGGEGPIVPQDTLVNPSFEPDLRGWTIDPPTAIAARYVYAQYPTNRKPYDGDWELATWHQTDAYTVTVSQTLTGLEPGTYTFSGWLSTTSTDGAYLFARNCGEPEVTVDIPPLSFDWFQITIQSFTVSSDSCEVGISISGDATGASGMPDWLNADMFSFTKDP
jgi:hypothetical protein